MNSLAQSIYKTLALFDVQDIPLTLMDIRGYLVRVNNLPPAPVSLSNIEFVLTTELNEFIEQQDGFYFLSGRQALVALRQERYRISLVRLRKARRYLQGLRFLPYIRAVAISGSLSFLNSKSTSDIDLFIMAKPGRIWLARVLVSMYFQLFGQRRHGKYIADRFCLNHYVREDLTVTVDRDLFTAVAYAGIIPVLGAQSLRRFWARNTWIEQFLVNPILQTDQVYFGAKFSPLAKFFERLLDFTGGPLLNSIFGRYQRWRIKPREDIIVSDEELSFHFHLHGRKVLASYAEALDKLDF